MSDVLVHPEHRVASKPKDVVEGYGCKGVQGRPTTPKGCEASKYWYQKAIPTWAHVMNSIKNNQGLDGRRKKTRRKRRRVRGGRTKCQCKLLLLELFTPQQRDILMARLLQNIFFPRQGNNQTNEDLVSSLKRSRTFTSEQVEQGDFQITPQIDNFSDVSHTSSILCYWRLVSRSLPWQSSQVLKDGLQHFVRDEFLFCLTVCSAPHMHAMCLDNLNVQPGNIILDIGSGSGIFTAYCAFIAGPVSYPSLDS